MKTISRTICIHIILCPPKPIIGEDATTTTDNYINTTEPAPSLFVLPFPRMTAPLSIETTDASKHELVNRRELETKPQSAMAAQSAAAACVRASTRAAEAAIMEPACAAHAAQQQRRSLAPAPRPFTPSQASHRSPGLHLHDKRRRRRRSADRLLAHRARACTAASRWSCSPRGGIGLSCGRFARLPYTVSL